jgi:hypothetical protein
MVAPLGGNAGDLGAPSTYLEDVDGGPLGGVDGGAGAPTTFFKDVDGAPLGGDDGGPGAPTTFLEDVNDGPPWRQCRRSESVYHLSQKHRWRPPGRR